MSNIFKCPSCYTDIIVFSNEINCGIFRHGIYKHNYEQIDPHASKEICDELVNQNKIFGCGKPFRILTNNDNYIIEKCSYV